MGQFDWKWQPEAEAPAVKQSWLGGIFGTGRAEPETKTFDWKYESPEAAQERVSSDYKLTGFEGFGSSAVSSIFELFGADPGIPSVLGPQAKTRIETWRDENPIQNIVSQLAGFAVPYIGFEKAVMSVPKAVQAIEGVTAGTLRAFGAAESATKAASISRGALHELYKFTPLELGRLASGWAVGADMGDMFADVALSQALVGSIGGIGGFFRAGGKVINDSLGDLPATEQGLLPAFELRIEKTRGDPASVEYQQKVFDRQQEALQWVPETAKKGEKGHYVYNVEGATPETLGWLESMFKPNYSNETAEAITKRGVDIRQLHSDGRSWSVGEGIGDTTAQKAGLKDLSELAETLVGPRLNTIMDKRYAGMMGGQMQKLIDQEAMFRIADDTWALKEDGGLWIMMKRVEKGPEFPAGAVSEEALADVKPLRRNPSFGPAGIRQGDQWLIGKTDQIHKFAPENAKLSKSVVESWAKMEAPQRQLRLEDPYSQGMDTVQKWLPADDWKLMQHMNKVSWTRNFVPKLAAKVKASTGLADNAQIQEMAEHLWDVAAPKTFKMSADPIYGRALALFEHTQRQAAERVNKLHDGVMQVKGTGMQAITGKNVSYEGVDGLEAINPLIYSLNEKQLQEYALISTMELPAHGKVLDELVADGVVSPKTADVTRRLQAINKHEIDNQIMPALREAGIDGQFVPLEGYSTPRVYQGDFMVRVVDEEGKMVKLVDAPSIDGAQTIANAIVSEAKVAGKNWSIGKAESKAFKGTSEGETLSDVFKKVDEQMGQNADAQAIVTKAIRGLLAEQSSKATFPGRPPATMTKKRTGVPWAPEASHITHEDAIAASKNHYARLHKFAGAHSWNNRFGGQIEKWGGKNSVKYDSLMRHVGQSLGIEGKYTQRINDLAQPVLGKYLGPKAATRLSNAVNSVMYEWILGVLNPSFAALNTMQILVTGAPLTAFLQRAPRANVAGMFQMELQLTPEGKVSGLMGVLAPAKVIRGALKLLRNPTQELQEFYGRLVQNGTLSAQQKDAWIGPDAHAAHSIKDAYGKGFISGFKETVTWMSRRSEQFSRLLAVNSGYIIGKQLFGKEGDELLEFMRKYTEQSMYGYALTDRSRVLTGPIGGTFGLFKNFQFHFVGQMAQYAGLAMNEKVFAPLLWQGASTLAIGGLGAYPLVKMADGLASWYTDSPNSFHYLMKEWAGPVGDAIYFGLPSLLGLSLQASSTLPGVDVTQDIESLSNVVMWQKGKAAAEAVGGAWDLGVGAGMNPLTNKNTVDKLVSAFAPRAVSRLYSAVEGDYIRSTATGYPVVRDLSPATKALYAAGFNMTEIEKYYIAGRWSFKKQEERSAATVALGEAMGQAMLYNDVEEQTRVMRRATLMGLDAQKVAKSGTTRFNRETLQDHLSRYDKQDQVIWRDVLGGED